MIYFRRLGQPGLHGHLDTKQDNCYCWPDDATAAIWFNPADFTNYMARVRSEVPDESMRDNEDADDEDDYFDPDPEVEERRQIFLMVMEEHPDWAFTGASVSDYIHNGGELESAGMEDAHLEAYHEDRYIDDSGY